ncbi:MULTISPECIES: adenylosuccinate lyase [unclassified Campylobacter]|uniref:adenylosuccinate lyase n=1 Tax=unclassified Campylobacter TaxID=2593542 RepID=UPI001474487E|nr:MULTISPECIES: adenylosuccinate lyase [unclassified Campylobacter]
MNVKQTLESLSIETADSKLFCELQSVMKKNFSKTLGHKDKVISFYDENELVQRRYFFKFISKLYEKANNQELDIKFAEYKTIKLLYKQQNSLKIIISAEVKFAKNKVNFSFKKPNSLFISYIAQKFKNSEIFTDENQKSLTIIIKDSTEAKGLDELFEKNEHMYFSVSFNYKQIEFAKFKREINIQNSQKFVRRFSALAELFNEHFKTLECETDSSFGRVRSRYLELVKIYHPDRHAGKSAKIQDEYRMKFEKIQNAYESLKPYFKEQEIFANAV